MLVALSRTQLAGQSVCVASRGHLAGSVGVIRAGFFIIYPLDPPLFQYFSRAREVVWHGFLQFRPQSGILCALFLALLFYPLLPPATSTWHSGVAAMVEKCPECPFLINSVRWGMWRTAFSFSASNPFFARTFYPLLPPGVPAGWSS